VVKASWRRRGLDETLTAQPTYALVGVLRIPESRDPTRAIWRRVAIAVLAMLVAAAVVYLDRGGYTDVRGKPLSVLDCVYFAVVSLTTIGYGDITPVTESARLINILLITPLRVAFLIVLVGTTVQVLAERQRKTIKIERWRKRVRNHTIVVGYGTKGRTAIGAMLSDDVNPSDIVVVDVDRVALDHADGAGLVAVLATLTAREIAPKAKIIASVREGENRHSLQQSGADSVVISSETAGRLLGVATTTPSVVAMIEDLLTPAEGFAIAERDVEQTEVGGSPRHLSEIVLGVVRDGHLLRVDAPEVDAIEAGDRLLYVRSAGK
jgi:voltage-gated potassium channel